MHTLRAVEEHLHTKGKRKVTVGVNECVCDFTYYREQNAEYCSKRILVLKCFSCLLITALGMDSGYQTVGGFPSSPDVPLFGTAERSSGARMINVIIGFITIFIVVFTMISAFVFNKNSSRGLNITFAVIIAMICTSHLLLIFWYRQGDMGDKFKKLIYYNAFCLTLLCVCANIYFHGV